MHDRNVIPQLNVRRATRDLLYAAIESQARNLGLAVAIGVWLAYLAFKTPFYFSIDNFLVVGLQMGFIGIAAAGMSLLMISGNVDLSIGSMFAVCATMSAIASKHTNPVVAILAGIATGGVIGLVNGVLVWRIKISPIIITLGGLTALRGVVTLMTNGYSIVGVPAGFERFGQAKIFGVQSPIWAFAAAMVIAWFVLHQTIIGRHVYAVGGSRQASEAAGINVRRLVIGLFVFNGLVVGLAGVLSASRLGTANPTFGVGFELDVITAVILGGVAFAGGEGAILGVVLAIVLIGNIENGLIALGVDPAWTDVAKGTILIIAVALDQFTAEQRERYRKAMAMRERRADDAAYQASRPADNPDRETVLQSDT